MIKYQVENAGSSPAPGALIYARLVLIGKTLVGVDYLTGECGFESGTVGPFEKNIFTKKLKIGKIFDIIYLQFKNCKMFFEKLVSVIRTRVVSL